MEKDSSLLRGQDEPETQWVSKWDPWRGSYLIPIYIRNLSPTVGTLTSRPVNLRNITGQNSKSGWPSSPCPDLPMETANRKRETRGKGTRQGAGPAALQESHLVTRRGSRPLLSRPGEVLQASPHSPLQQQTPGRGKGAGEGEQPQTSLDHAVRA